MKTTVGNFTIELWGSKGDEQVWTVSRTDDCEAPGYYFCGTLDQAIQHVENTEKYKCQCGSCWNLNEPLPKKCEHAGWKEYLEAEGCPDCLHECERCGMLTDGKGGLEHCL